MNLSFLNDDVLLYIISFLKPHDVTNLPVLFVTELFQRNQHFKMPCYTYIHDDIVKWFEMNHLPLDLLIEHRKFGFSEMYLKNGYLHREDDLPAYIHHQPGSSCQIWYQHGKIHRDGDQPAHISEHLQVKKWYKNGVLIKKVNYDEQMKQ
jgi:hypothetical protein